MDWKACLRKSKEIKNGLRTLFLSSFLSCGKCIQTPSALSLPNHRQRLSVVILPEHIAPPSISVRAELVEVGTDPPEPSKKFFNQPPSTNSRQESSWPFQSLPFDRLRTGQTDWKDIPRKAFQIKKIIKIFLNRSSVILAISVFYFNFLC
jgi:hypothetical protein